MAYCAYLLTKRFANNTRDLPIKKKLGIPEVYLEDLDIPIMKNENENGFLQSTYTCIDRGDSSHCRLEGGGF